MARGLTSTGGRAYDTPVARPKPCYYYYHHSPPLIYIAKLDQQPQQHDKVVNVTENYTIISYFDENMFCFKIYVSKYVFFFKILKKKYMDRVLKLGQSG